MSSTARSRRSRPSCRHPRAPDRMTLVPLSAEPGAALLRRGRPRWGERVIQALLATCAGLSVLTTLGIAVALAVPTVGFFRSVGVGEFLLGTVWTPLFADKSFGVLPLVSGTLLITVIALV